MWNKKHDEWHWYLRPKKAHRKKKKIVEESDIIPLKRDIEGSSSCGLKVPGKLSWSCELRKTMSVMHWLVVSELNEVSDAVFIEVVWFTWVLAWVVFGLNL